ncbi:sugar transferase [bacterium]|nr:sugar transferase [bacterium]
MALKRLIDLVLSAVGLLFLAIPMAVISVIIKVTSPGPIFFRQKRIGLHKIPFEMLKFRTMVVDADKLGPHVTALHDPRIYPFGNILRRTKLDELPELWNVFCGDMSLVGPRPEVPKYVKCYPTDWDKIFIVRPGITDIATFIFRDEEKLLADVNDRENAYINFVVPVKAKLAMQYVERVSLLTDFSILWHTVKAITVGKLRSDEHSPIISNLQKKIRLSDN